MGIFRIVGVDTHCGITHYCFGTSGCHDSITIFAFNLVAQVVKFAVLFLVNYFLVGQSRLCLRVPVDHTNAAVNQPLVVKVAENLDNALRALFVHSESGTVPVARSAELAKLLKDDTTVFVSPVPSVLQKFVAAEVGFLYALLSKFVDNLCFGCNGCVVGTGHPDCILSRHAGTADKNILNSIVEHVSHVEDSRYIWRGNYNNVWFTVIGFRMEELMFCPVVVPFLFNLLRFVFG